MSCAYLSGFSSSLCFVPGYGHADESVIATLLPSHTHQRSEAVIKSALENSKCTPDSSPSLLCSHGWPAPWVFSNPPCFHLQASKGGPLPSSSLHYLSKHCPHNLSFPHFLLHSLSPPCIHPKCALSKIKGKTNLKNPG